MSAAPVILEAVALWAALAAPAEEPAHPGSAAQVAALAVEPWARLCPARWAAPVVEAAGPPLPVLKVPLSTLQAFVSSLFSSLLVPYRP